MKDQRAVKNLLVTGGAGFIGSAFIRYLLSEKRLFDGLCINLDALTYAGNLSNLESIAEDPRYFFHQGSICDEALVEKICIDYQVDTLIHFAAESHVDRSIAQPGTFMETNILGTYHLLEVVRRLPHIHFHHVSTDEVFGSLDASGYFREDSPYRPNSPYSASKAASDHLVRAYHHTYGLSVTLSNCSNNYGPYHFPEKFIPLLILNALDRKKLPIYGSGLQVRDWLYVEDHAEALDLILRKAPSGETYAIGGECEKTNQAVALKILEKIARATQSSLQELQPLMTYVKDRPGHDFRYAIDCSKIKKTLGWSPKHDFDQGIEKTIAWYMAHPQWVAHIRSGAYLHWVASHYSE